MTPHEQIADIVKVAPPITITGMKLAGYSVSDWVFVLTAIYTLLQIFFLIRRMWKTQGPEKSGKCSTHDCPARKP